MIIGRYLSRVEKEWGRRGDGVDRTWGEYGKGIFL